MQVHKSKSEAIQFLKQEGNTACKCIGRTMEELKSKKKQMSIRTWVSIDQQQDVLTTHNIKGGTKSSFLFRKR